VSSFVSSISVREEVTGGLQPPQFGRNLFHWGNFSEKPIGDSGNFSDCSPDLFDLLDKKFTPPLNLKPPYAHVKSPYAHGFVCDDSSENHTPEYFIR